MQQINVQPKKKNYKKKSILMIQMSLQWPKKAYITFN